MDYEHVVLLGCGYVGAQIAKELVNIKGFPSLVIGDNVSDKANKLADELKESPVKVIAAEVDAEDEQSIFGLLKNASLLINATGPYERTTIPSIKAAIRAKVAYVDVDANTAATRQAISLDKEAKDAGISALVGFGDVPGLINIIARYGADKLDEVHEVHFAVIGPRKAFNSNILHRLWQNTFKSPATIYQDGQFTNVPSCKANETITLPWDTSEVEVISATMPMVFTVPRFLPNVKLVTVKVGLNPPDKGNSVLNSFLDWGLFSREPIDVKGNQIKPEEFSLSFLGSQSHIDALDLSSVPMITGQRISISGIKNGEEAKFIYYYKDTSLALTENICKQAITMLMRGDIKSKGVLAPEALDPKPFVKMALEQGIYIKEISEQIL
jgi:saccharopine dehydrogenase-like NADP-dependent oxidoreductase